MFITKYEGYIVAFGKAETEVETDEYILLTEVVKSKPTPPTGYDYRLKEDLTWELFELPQCSESESFYSDSDYAEAGKILMGVSE